MTVFVFFFFFFFFFLIPESGNSREDEWLNTLKRFMEPTLQSVEQALQEAEAQRLFENNQALLAMSQVQLIRQALEASNVEALTQALAISFEQLGFSLEEVKHDIQRL